MEKEKSRIGEDEIVLRINSAIAKEGLELVCSALEENEYLVHGRFYLRDAFGGVVAEDVDIYGFGNINGGDFVAKVCDALLAMAGIELDALEEEEMTGLD